MQASKEPIRVALIGAGHRATGLYAPILEALSSEVKLVAVWSRSEASARPLAEREGVPWYTDIDRLTRETAPQIGIVSVKSKANGQVGLMAVQQGLHILIDTPIAQKLSEADAMMAAAKQRGVKIEVSEQFPRRPAEQLKLKLLASGLFGRVYASFNDFSGHAYHGVSIMRSYLGFDAVPTYVVGAARRYQMDPHWSVVYNRIGNRHETQEHGIIDFKGGQIGIFHWSGVAYDCGLRWWRSSRFLAEKGMGIQVGIGLDQHEWLTLLDPSREGPQIIYVERRFQRDDGGAMVAMIAHTGVPDLPIVRWDNPFAAIRGGRGVQWHDDEIGAAGCLMSLVDAVRDNTEPSYGPLQGRLDQEIAIAIRRSSRLGGQPVHLPLDPAIGTDCEGGFDPFDD